MRHRSRTLRSAVPALLMLTIAGCGGIDGAPMPPSGPTPNPEPTVTASAYILPGAAGMGDFAFGDEPVVVYRSERLRWVNSDREAHLIVADSPDATDFRKTGELTPGGEQSFTMTKPGSTRIHCAIHPSMTGTLIVRDR